jgi:hypothetical protein
VAVDRIRSKRVDQLMLYRNQRVEIGDTVRGKLKDELILHRGFGSNETEISHGTVLWQTHRSYFATGPLDSSTRYRREESTGLSGGSRKFKRYRRNLTKSACPIRLRLAIWAQNLQVRS